MEIRSLLLLRFLSAHVRPSARPPSTAAHLPPAKRSLSPAQAVTVAAVPVVGVVVAGLPCVILSLSLSVAATYSRLRPPVFAAGSRPPLVCRSSSSSSPSTAPPPVRCVLSLSLILLAAESNYICSSSTVLDRRSPAVRLAAGHQLVTDLSASRRRRRR
jgi:hypothetical protein